VVVVLMDFSVLDNLLLLPSLFSDGLFLYRWGNTLVDGGVMMSRFGEDVAYGCLGFVHDD